MSPSPDHSATVTALTIAGSDPSGGAGIQADMKAMSALGAYAMSVITALTAQSTRGVTGVHAVPVDFVRLQLDTLLEDIVPEATKIGMLATAELADAERHIAQNGNAKMIFFDLTLRITVLLKK